MSTLNNAIARAKELLELNPSYTKAKLTAFLTIDDYAPKIIKEALETVAPAKAKKASFASMYYDFLASEERTLQEATDYIQGVGEYGETSDNIKKHLSHYLAIHGLSVAVFNKVQKEDTRSDEHKQAYKTHDDIKAEHESGKVFTKAEASKAHPDKVAQFNDAKLTEMYNELYKSLNIKSRARKAA